MRKGIVVGLVVFLVGSMLTQSVVAERVDHVRGPVGRRYFLCPIHLEYGEIRNFHGYFFGVPISGVDLYFLGFGTFSVDISGVFVLRLFHYFYSGHVLLRGFFGCFQPTGDLSSGCLDGFALLIRVDPLSSGQPQIPFLASQCGKYMEEGR